jgi:hypothetical protein
MPRPFDIIKARRAVRDLHSLGPKAAAKKHKVTERTLWLWQKRLASEDKEILKDPRVDKILEEAGSDWRKKLRAAIGVGLERLAAIAGQETDPDKLSRAIERLAEVEVTAEALGVGASSASEGSEPSSGKKKS